MEALDIGRKEVALTAVLALASTHNLAAVKKKKYVALI